MNLLILEKIMNVVIQKSMRISSTHHLTHIHHKGDVELPDPDKMYFIKKLMDVGNLDINEAVNKYNTICKKNFKQRLNTMGWWIFPIIGVFVMLILFFAIGDLALCSYFIFLASLITLVAYFTTGKKRKAGKIYDEFSDKLLNDEIVNKMAAVYEKNIFSCSNPLILVILFVLLVAGIFGMIYFNKDVPQMPLEDKTYTEIRNAVTGMDTQSELDAMMKLVDKKTTEETENILNRLAENSMRSSRFAVAVFTHQLVKEEKVSVETGKKVICDMLGSFDASVISNDFERRNAIDILEYTDTELTGKILKDLINKRGSDEKMAGYLGEYYGKKGNVDDALYAYNIIEQKKVFIEKMLGNMKIEEILNGIDIVENKEQFLKEVLKETNNIESLEVILNKCEKKREVLIHIADNFTKPDEVLAFLRLAEKFSVKPTECYPDGAVLDWDLSYLNMFENEEELKECNKIMVLKRTEKEEKLEKKLLSSESEIAYDENYESNAEIGKDAFVLILDTEAMERMPADRIPYSISELVYVLVFDVQYVRDGYINERHTLMYNDDSKEDEISYYQYPAYSVIEAATVYDIHTGKEVYTFDYKLIDRRENVNNQLNGIFLAGNNDYNYLGKVEDVYLAKIDHEWIEQERKAVYEMLDVYSWDLILTAYSDYVSDSSK